jgi:Response regulators consisting of a CheY-like receiver domain and a winged-helix DNA-binding domain
MDTKQTILIVDDEIQIRRLLEITLSANDYKIIEADNGKDGCTLAASFNPTLIILDLGLPDQDGLDVLKKLREWFTSPIIILSARNSEEDIIKALDRGANDYLTKPFRTGELLARIRVATRQNSRQQEATLVFDNLTIDLDKHLAYQNGEIIKLTSTEFSLLALMAKNEGRVLTHTYILKEIWGYGYTEQTQYLRVFIAQLRKKIEEDPSKPKLLITESGIGYRFNGI